MLSTAELTFVLQLWLHPIGPPAPSPRERLLAAELQGPLQVAAIETGARACPPPRLRMREKILALGDTDLGTWGCPSVLWEQNMPVDGLRSTAQFGGFVGEGEV